MERLMIRLGIGLYLGFVLLLFSSFGNWAYTIRAHRKVRGGLTKSARDILNERYALGEITREQFEQIKADVSNA